MPHTLFNPRSIAVIGATADPMKFGYVVTKNLLAGTGGQITVYPVTPSGAAVLGIPAFPSVTQIPGAVDVAIILVPRRIVPAVVDQCLLKGVKRLVIITAGFGEIDAAGKALERELAAKCRQAGARLVGPNCVGFQNVSARLNASFIQVPQLGDISMVSQSGSFAAACFWEWDWQSAGIAKFINIGNAADISFPEILAYYRNDPETHVIAIYLESLANGRELFQAVKAITPVKPVVVMKGGRTRKGLEAASSHTGSLAADYAVTKAAMQQAGAVVCETMDDYITAVKVLSKCPLPQGDRVGVLTSSGGSSVLFSDFADGFGLKYADFSPALIAQIRPHVMPLVKFVNPLDMIASAGDEQFYQVTKAMLADPNVDVVVACSLFGDFLGNTPAGHLQACLKAWNESGRQKPLIPLMIYEHRFGSVMETMDQEKCAVFFSPREAAYATAVLVQRYRWLHAKSNFDGN